MSPTAWARNTSPAFGKASEQSSGYYSFDHPWRAFRRPGQCDELQAQRTWRVWATTSSRGSREDLAGRSASTAHRGVRAHADVDDLRALGLGHGRCRPDRRTSCAASAPSPCSTATSTRSCRKWKATSPSTPPARPPIPKPSRGVGRARVRWWSRPISCPACWASPLPWRAASRCASTDDRPGLTRRTV